MQKNLKLKYIVLSGLFSAIIFLVTYLFHIPTSNGGYVHVGDAVIYLAACLMPLQYAAPCAAIGGALSDALSGGTVWIIPTLIIKSVITLFFTSKSEKILCRRNVAAIFIAGIVGVVSYDLVSSFLYHNIKALIVQLPLDMVQPVASGVLFAALGAAFDKAEIKKRFFKF